MKFEHGWWFPDHEEHLQTWMTQMQQKAPGGRLGYQLHKYQLAMKFVKQHRLAVDVGGHIGLWSWPMAHDFERVLAFEPMPRHRECWLKNLEGAPAKISLEPCALGNRTNETVWMRTRTPGSSGDTGVDPAAKTSSLRASVHEPSEGEPVPLRMLDEFNLQDVDFLKLDCEGYEVFVLKGAIETLKRCRPCVIVEQKPETGMEERYGIKTTDGVRFLESLGAVRRAGVQGDYVLSWD